MRRVFVNGTFDLLHLGHLRLLRYARSLGDHLTVAVNTDDGVRRLRDASRPIRDETTRVSFLEEMRCVDQVLLFDTDPRAPIIASLPIHLVVKGAEYRDKNYPERDWLIEQQIEVEYYDSGVETHSTDLIRKFRSHPLVFEAPMLTLPPEFERGYEAGFKRACDMFEEFSADNVSEMR